jgi:DNA ligase-1
MKVNNKEIVARLDGTKYIFPTLYAQDKNGKTMYSDMYVEGNGIFRSKGYMGGKKTHYKPTLCVGKNMSKTNETTDHTQALLEAQSKHEKKMTRGNYSMSSVVKEERKNCAISPMLAKKYTDQKKKLTFPCAVSEKLDGCRCASVNDGGSILLVSRTKKEFNFLYTVRTHLKTILSNGHRLDGELYSHTIPFNKIISIVRQKSKASEHDSIIEYWIYDIPEVGDTYEERVKKIKGYEAVYNNLYPNPHDRVLRFVYYELASKEEDIKAIHDKYIAIGYEGAMIRVLNSQYEFSRSSSLLKYKEFHDEEFKVVGATQGKGGDIGTVIFECITNEGEVFNVRPRGSVAKRRWQYDNKEMYIGQKLTVRFQYDGEYTHQTKPRFGVGIKFDPTTIKCEPVEFRNYE